MKGGAMPLVTAAVLAAFVGYAAAWYFEMVEGMLNSL